MTQRIKIYNNREEMLLAREIGFRLIHINFKDDKIEGVWTDEPEINIPPRTLTQRAFIEELAKYNHIKLV